MVEDISMNFEVGKALPPKDPKAEPAKEEETKRPAQKSSLAGKRKKKAKDKLLQHEDKYLKTLEDSSGAQRDVFSVTKFDDLPVCDKLKSSLRENSYSMMTQIQQRAIPAILANQFVLVKSETGSGKTFAYLVPILEKLYQLSIKDEASKITRAKGTYVLIFSPTRELATQIYESCLKLTKRLSFIVCGALMGGESMKREKARLRKGLNVLIVTPGRFLYHLQNTKSMVLSNLQCIVIPLVKAR